MRPGPPLLRAQGHQEPAHQGHGGPHRVLLLRKEAEAVSLVVVPITLRAANAFVEAHHRHHKAARGHKFSVAVADGSTDAIVGVAIAGRPTARALDDGFTIEINRVCTTGEPNACSMLYGACRKAARAMGYRRVVTYTQQEESGASLRAAGFRLASELPARKSWAASSVKLRELRDPVGSGGVERIRWEFP